MVVLDGEMAKPTVKPSAALEERRFQDGEAASRAQLPDMALHAERDVERMALVHTTPNMGNPGVVGARSPARGRGGVVKPKSTWLPDERLLIYGIYFITPDLLTAPRKISCLDGEFSKT